MGGEEERGRDGADGAAQEAGGGDGSDERGGIERNGRGRRLGSRTRVGALSAKA